MLVTGRSLTLIVKHEKKSLGSFADIKLLSHPDDCRKPLSLKCLFTISLSMSLCSFFILALFCLHLCCLLSPPPFLLPCLVLYSRSAFGRVMRTGEMNWPDKRVKTPKAILPLVFGWKLEMALILSRIMSQMEIRAERNV